VKKGFIVRQAKFILGLCIFLVCFSNVRAQVYTFEFSGHIYSSGGQYSNIPQALRNIEGQNFSGWFQYDDSISPVIENAGTVYERYHYDQIASIEVNLDHLSTSHINSPVSISVDNNRYEPRSRMYYDYFSYSFISVLPDYGSAEYQMYFRDTTGTAFNSFALPTSFDLSDFQADVFNIYMGTVNNPIHFYGLVDTIALVPEPASLLLFSLGGLLIRRK
jgi:hypothetical protein